MKHEALIRKVLDGVVIQYRHTGGGVGWATFDNLRFAIAHMAAEYTAFEYRVKPPDDRVVYRCMGDGKCKDHPNLEFRSGLNITKYEWFKITYEGDSKKIKSVEAL